jgi:iron complex transport system ATP-binding protein
MSAPPLLTLSDVAVALGGRAVLAGVSLSVGQGELVIIVGPNGAGKSTLMRAAAGLVAASGSVLLSGRPLSSLALAERARRLSYLPQGHPFFWPLAVADVVALGRLAQGAGGDLSVADEAAVERAMALTGITGLASRPVTTLSGGERARVALARVLATEAPLILADEPTASLDPRYQLDVMGILRGHASAGGAVLAVLHDLALAARSADRVIVLHEGRVVADDAPGAVINQTLLADVFGISLVTGEVAGVPVVVPVSVSRS